MTTLPIFSLWIDRSASRYLSMFSGLLLISNTYNVNSQKELKRKVKNLSLSTRRIPLPQLELATVN